MLISKKVKIEEQKPFTQLQKMATQFLPEEQVSKFGEFQHLIEKELLNEAREPEMANLIKDIFDALHERNTPKLLKTLRGDEERFFYAFKKQLEAKEKLTKKEAEILHLINRKRISLVTLSAIK